MAYTGSYPLYVGPGQYNVDPSVDPAVQTPINSGEATLTVDITVVLYCLASAGHVVVL